MAGTVTVTEEATGTVKKVTFDWLSDAAGVADAVTDEPARGHDGHVERVLFLPDSGGTAPDDGYDVLLYDADSRDLLYGQGANLPQANDVAVVANLGWITNDQITLRVTGAGNANGGIVVVYIR